MLKLLYLDIFFMKHLKRGEQVALPMNIWRLSGRWPDGILTGMTGLRSEAATASSSYNFQNLVHITLPRSFDINILQADTFSV